MAYDKLLAERVQGVLARRRNIQQKMMFGGVGFLLKGNMCVGVWKECLVARLGPEEYDAALREPGVKQFDITGRAMSGWVLVGPSALDGAKLQSWIARAIGYVKLLPPKLK